jgi:hypothetical protein
MGPFSLSLRTGQDCGLEKKKQAGLTKPGSMPSPLLAMGHRRPKTMDYSPASAASCLCAIGPCRTNVGWRHVAGAVGFHVEYSKASLTKTGYGADDQDSTRLNNDALNHKVKPSVDEAYPVAAQ